MTNKKTWWGDDYPEIARDVAADINAAGVPKAKALPLLRQLARDHGLIPIDFVEPAPHFERLEAAVALLGPKALMVLEEIAERLARNASAEQEEMIERLVLAHAHE